jgi:hypothetical protein
MEPLRRATMQDCGRVRFKQKAVPTGSGWKGTMKVFVRAVENGRSASDV